MKSLPILAFFIACAACSSKIVVHHVSESPSRLEKPAAYYVLPKTRLSATIPYTRITYTPGKLEEFFKDHEKEFGLKSARPDNWATCSVEDKANSPRQIRFGYDAVNKLTSSGIPDESQIYAVDMKAESFQDIKIGLESSPDLIVGAASATSSSAASGFVGAIASVVTTSISRDEPPQDLAKLTEIRREKLKLRNEVVAKLKEVNTRLNQILYTSSVSHDLGPILERLETRQKQLKAMFEGGVSEKEDSIIIEWTPEPMTTNVPVTVCCKVPDVTQCNLKTNGSDTPRLNCQSDSSCPDPSKTDPANTLYLMAVENQGTYEIRKEIRSKDYLSNHSASEYGFAYRIPAKVTLSVTLNSQNKAEALGQFETHVAQFGDVFRLPADIGTGKTEISLSYHAQLGALKSLSAGGVGMSTDTLQQTAVDILEPDDELDKLERQYKILDYEKKIRELQSEPSDAGDTP